MHRTVDDERFVVNGTDISKPKDKHTLYLGYRVWSVNLVAGDSIKSFANAQACILSPDIALTAIGSGQAI